MRYCSSVTSFSGSSRDTPPPPQCRCSGAVRDVRVNEGRLTWWSCEVRHHHLCPTIENASGLYLPDGTAELSVIALGGVGRSRSRIGVEEELSNKSVRRCRISGIQCRALGGAQHSVPDSQPREAAFEEAFEIARPQSQRRRSSDRIDFQSPVSDPAVRSARPK